MCLRLRNYSRQLDFEVIEANVNDGVLGVLFSEGDGSIWDGMGWYGMVTNGMGMCWSSLEST